MRAEDAIRIRHMIEAAKSAQDFVAGRAKGDLDRDKMLRFAVVHAVQVIGEVSDLLVQLRSVDLPDPAAS